MNFPVQIKDNSYLRTAYHKLIANETVFIFLFSMAIFLIALSHLVFLTTLPSVFIDEAWYANAAWNWLQSGTNYDTMHAGVLDQTGYWPIIGNMPWLISFYTLGLGLFQARLVSWVFGILLLLVTIIAGRQSYSMITGVLAALLLSLSPIYFQASHYARPDIIIAVMVMGVYVLALLAFEKNRWWLHLLAGLIIGLSLDVHQNGFLFAPALAAMYWIFYGKNVLRQPGTWLAGLGGLVGIVYYTAGHIFPYLGDSFGMFSLSFSGPHKLPLLSLNPIALLASARAEIGRYHFFENGLDFALIGASIAYLAVRHSKKDLLLLTFVGVAFSCFVLFVGNKHDIYAILLYPFFMMIIAEVLISLIRQGQEINTQRAFASILLFLILFNGTVHYSRQINDNRHYNYNEIISKIESVIPADNNTRIMGLPHWWLGLAEYDYRSSLNLTFYHMQNGYSLTEGLETEHPDILIVDTGLQGLLVDEGFFPSGPGFEIYKLPRQEFNDFLSQRGDILLEFTDPWHGNFEIYAIDWD